MYSYVVKLGGCLHIVKDHEVNDLFTLIEWKMRLSRAQAERILHEGKPISEPGHFQVTAIRKHRTERMEYPAPVHVPEGFILMQTPRRVM